MKVRRSERLVDMTQYLLNHPHELISLTSFAERYESAKSSISEDLGIIKKTFKERGYGTLETIPGAAGGVLFIPEISYEEAKKYIESLAERLSEQDRLLPGGYVYLSDLLGEPELLRQVGRIIASKYLGEKNRCCNDCSHKRRTYCPSCVLLSECAIRYCTPGLKNNRRINSKCQLCVWIF